MPIDSRHPEYSEMLPKWKMIDDVLSDNPDKLVKYLRELNPTDKSKENELRNEQYRANATWYGITSQTVKANIGTMFRRTPIPELPKELEYMLKNSNGKGQSIVQTSQRDAYSVLSKGRSGLFTTHPKTEGKISRADVLSGKYVATIESIDAKNIIMWRETTVGSKVVLSLVVILTNEVVIGDDGYEMKTEPKILELYLEDEIFKQREWSKNKETWVKGEALVPADSKGKPWKEIPFTFIGAETNDTEVDDPPVLPLAMMNLKHFANSADNEECVYWGIQNQPFVDSDVSASLVKEMLEAGAVYYGNRRLMPFKIGVASSPENTQVSAEMDRKEQKMIGLGARITENNTAAKTAYQVGGEREGKTSILSMVAANVSEAYTKALKWACRYMGADENAVSYEINRDFVTLDMDPQLIQAVMQGHRLGDIPTADYVRFMKRMGMFDDETPDEDYLDMLPTPGGMV